MSAHEVAEILVAHRFRWTSEYQLQDSIGAVLTAAGHDVERERVIGSAGRLDFYLPDLRVGVEVKVQGSLPALLRQLGRYARHDDIDGLVVASTVARHRGLPTDIFGVPVAIAPLIGDLL